MGAGKKTGKKICDRHPWKWRHIWKLSHGSWKVNALFLSESAEWNDLRTPVPSSFYTYIYQPFHRDSCDILTENNILLVPNLYNNYSGLVKLWYFVKVVASYALAKKRHWWVTRYKNKWCWIRDSRDAPRNCFSRFSRTHVISWATSRLNINVLHGIASWYSCLSITSLVLMTLFTYIF